MLLIDFDAEDEKDAENEGGKETELTIVVLLGKSELFANFSVGTSCTGHLCKQKCQREPTIIIHPLESLKEICNPFTFDKTG